MEKEVISLSLEQARELVEAHIGRTERTGEEYVRACCPIHEADGDKHSPSFWVNLKYLTCGCFAGCFSGKLWELLRQMRASPVIWECVRKSTVAPPVKMSLYHGRDPHKAATVLPDAVMAAFDFPPTPLLEKGFDPDVLKDHDVGYDTRHEWVVFGVRDIHGNLAGISARTQDPSNKYRFLVRELQDVFPGYTLDKSRHLWNGHRVMKLSEGMVREEPVILVEGYKAGLHLCQCGIENVVACMGSSLSDLQADALALIGHPVIIFLDNNQAGWAGTKKSGNKLRDKKMEVYVAKYPVDAEVETQPDDLSIDEVKSALTTASRFYRRRSQWTA